MSWFSSAINAITTPARTIIGDITGSTAQAAAAAASSQAQQSIAQQQLAVEQSQSAQQTAFQQTQYQNQLAARDTATAMAAPSASELAQSGINLNLQYSAITSQLAALDRDNKILDSIDPAIKEAGSQALELLQGKNAAILAPLQKQQTEQRTKLEQSLASSLGPDYATSSAGQAALANFDNNAAMTTANAQSQSLGQLLGVVQNANMNPVANSSNAFASLGNLNQTGFQMAQGQVNQQVNAYLGAPVNQQVQFQAPNFGNLFNAAGTVGNAQAVAGQGLGQAVSTIGSIGASIYNTNNIASAMAI